MSLLDFLTDALLGYYEILLGTTQIKVSVLMVFVQNLLKVDLRERHEIPRHQVQKVGALIGLLVVCFWLSSSFFTCLRSHFLSEKFRLCDVTSWMREELAFVFISQMFGFFV